MGTNLAISLKSILSPNDLCSLQGSSCRLSLESVEVDSRIKMPNSNSNSNSISISISISTVLVSVVDIGLVVRIITKE